jgi:hypothetical protein
MQDDLVGYLLGALETDEASRVSKALGSPSGGSSSSDAQSREGEGTPDAASTPRGSLPARSLEGRRLEEQLAVLRTGLAPLEFDRAPEPVPAGLASRTLTFVRSQAAAAATIQAAVEEPPIVAPALSPEPAPAVIPATRSFVDRVIMAATAIAAMVLLAPLLLDSIEDSRTRRVERKLGVLSGSLHGYADTHREYPTPPASGPLSRAGLYAPTLVAEHRLRSDDGTLLVPGSALSNSGTFRIPSVEELEEAVGTARLEMLVRQMGGDFGYTLGHRDENGSLQPIRDSRRGHHPIMADAPADHGLHAVNHPSGLHHILFEDGRVQRVFDPTFAADRDHLYHNHDGNIAAGVDIDDSAIGGSHHRP